MTVVQTTYGPVRGTSDGRVLSFRAIPYAAPPVGERRFRAAVAPDPWSEVRDALEPGPVSPQCFDPIDAVIGAREMPGSEADSLHLTVHTPSLEGSRAVFLWIHGGSFTSGSSAWEIYDGEHFARDGVVSVGINYRLGAFGFLDLRSVLDGDVTANIALTDAIMALEWVRDNIARFGGDPDRVTIAGESAGAGMVTALLSSPRARGLFRRAVPQSGVNFRFQEPEVAAIVARNFLELVGVAPGDRAALEALPTETVLWASEQRDRLLAGMPEDHYLSWAMHRDPETYPVPTYDVFAEGGTVGVDLLLGTTADEGKLHWITVEPDGVDRGVGGVDAATAARLRAVYAAQGRADTEWELSEAIENDRSYLVPTTWAAEEHARHGGTAYMYLFTWRSPVLGGRLGACHALENAFVFDRLDSPGFHGPHPPQRLADVVHAAWVAFAETGDPSTPRLPDWPLFDPDRPQKMELGDRCGTLNDPRGAERRVWVGQPPSLFGVG